MQTLPTEDHLRHLVNRSLRNSSDPIMGLAGCHKGRGGRGLNFSSHRFDTRTRRRNDEAEEDLREKKEKHPSFSKRQLKVIKSKCWNMGNCKGHFSAPPLFVRYGIKRKIDALA